MNCAIRSVVRSAIGAQLRPFGIQRGYAGLLEGDFREMPRSSVGNIIQKGGTILYSSRCKDFFQCDIRRKTAGILRERKIDALIVIGGNGSFAGAMKLHEEHGVPVIGIPATIDNDIKNCDMTIGFATAVQTAMDAVDKIRDTAYSHDRNFIVEVMGRKSPYIAIQVGVCAGAENVICPMIEGEVVDYERIASDIRMSMGRGKASSIIIVSEGERPGGLAYKMCETLWKDYEIETRVCILGHIQRGGNPTAPDRLMASKMGHQAIQALLKGEKAMAIVSKRGDVVSIPLKNCLGSKVFEQSSQSEIELAKSLSI